MADTQAVSALRAWLADRPAVHDLARRFPPGCKVTSREDAPLAVPSPGIVGTVVSYFEGGTLGVVAPMSETLTSPITGVTVGQGEQVKGECDPDRLVFIERGDVFSHADVEEALSDG